MVSVVVGVILYNRWDWNSWMPEATVLEQNISLSLKKVFRCFFSSQRSFFCLYYTLCMPESFSMMSRSVIQNLKIVLNVCKEDYYEGKFLIRTWKEVIGLVSKGELTPFQERLTKFKIYFFQIKICEYLFFSRQLICVHWTDKKCHSCVTSFLLKFLAGGWKRSLLWLVS